ncbi:MAG: selenophosphate synthase [Nocardioides sp.]|nr:selenophosphate synthase [Nocardioides sp.]
MTLDPHVPLPLSALLAAAKPEDCVRRVRDLLVFDAGPDTVVVLACDSSGSIGPKPHDVLQWDGVEVGRTVAKVPLMEVVAAGATPFVLVNTLAVEMEPTGRDILEGIRDVCSLLPGRPVITGSDETNMETFATGVGVTVLGAAARSSLRIGRSRPGDRLWVVGLPLGGRSGSTPDGGAATAGLDTVLQLIALDGVHEVLPVGSRGIAYEAGELADTVGLAVHLDEPVGIDLRRSAGASTCVVVSARSDLDLAAHVSDLPVIAIGKLV